MSNPAPTPTPVPLPQPNTDMYGCLANQGYYYSPSSGSCCKCDGCETPKPWVCKPDQLSATNSMDPHGCNTGTQVYDYSTGNCCNCVCMAPIAAPTPFTPQQQQPISMTASERFPRK
jgi:hypothetical protein